MLTLNDGRAELWQWDTGRTLSVDADCSQVHFSNKVFGRSIDVDVADGVAIIPDILLQTDKDLNVWAFVGTAENGYTKISKTFKVNRRNKPADYVFTPTDQITLQTIQSQIGDLDDLTTEAKENLVAAINEAARTGGVDVSGAQVGQTIRVSAVDENGKPTEWEAADIPSGVQPDWNQNDGTQPDYVKNRPFYTGGPVETTFVEDSTVSFTRNEYSGFYLGSLQSTFVATVGDTYKVSWDGTTYESTCVGADGYTIIGNLSRMGAGPDTGEPFTMIVYNRAGIEIATADTSASHTFSIGGFIPEIVKIDRKYLPKAACIVYDSSNSTYNSDLTNDELYEIMLNGGQVVLYNQSEKTYYYLKKWRTHPSGRIDLCFDREEFEITLFPDGTIGKTPNE